MPRANDIPPCPPASDDPRGFIELDRRIDSAGWERIRKAAPCGCQFEVKRRVTPTTSFSSCTLQECSAHSSLDDWTA